MNYFGRFYQGLPQQIRDSAAESVSTVKARCVVLADAEMARVKAEIQNALLHHAADFARQRQVYEVILPLAWLCLGIFVLSVLMFVAGSAVAGRGWGTHPLDMLLAAPAGWVLPIAAAPLSGYTIYLSGHSYLYTEEKKHLVSIIVAFAAVLIAIFCFLWLLLI
jgi:hypothetical protein